MALYRGLTHEELHREIKLAVMCLGVITMLMTTGSWNCMKSRWLWSEKRTELRSPWSTVLKVPSWMKGPEMRMRLDRQKDCRREVREGEGRI